MRLRPKGPSSLARSLARSLLEWNSTLAVPSPSIRPCFSASANARGVQCLIHGPPKANTRRSARATSDLGPEPPACQRRLRRFLVSDPSNIDPMRACVRGIEIASVILPFQPAPPCLPRPTLLPRGPSRLFRCTAFCQSSCVQSARVSATPKSACNCIHPLCLSLHARCHSRYVNGALSRTCSNFPTLHRPRRVFIA